MDCFDSQFQSTVHHSGDITGRSYRQLFILLHSQRQRKMNVGVQFDFSFLTRESRMTLPTFRTVFSS